MILLKRKITLSEVILGLLGIIMICVGYFLSTKLVENVDSILQPFVILFLTVLGSYFFFRSTVSLILKLYNTLEMAMSV